jgi:hypothetical protein
MSLPEKLSDTTQEHLERLIATRAQENMHLEFKRELPTKWDSATTNEFLADVTAFANATGGDLIYGIDEGPDAEASELIFQELEFDVETRRLADIHLNNVEPRIPGIQIQTVPLAREGKIGLAIVVRVPQSWDGPHRVTVSRKFYIRENARKRELNVPEIRGLFLRSENHAQRIRDFRTERLGKILINDLPCKLAEGGVLVLHVVPLQSALGQIRINPAQYGPLRHLPVIGTAAAYNIINLDGLLSVRHPNNAEIHGYTQLFRNGVFESTYVLARRELGVKANLPCEAYESHIIKHLNAIKGELEFLGISGEVSILLSVLRANAVKLGTGPGFLDGPSGDFDRNELVLPDIVIDPKGNLGKELRPVFDYVWQCAGFDESKNFDNAGNWVGVSRLTR